MQLSHNWKIFAQFFPSFPKCKWILNTLKKKWSSELICFWNDTLEKAVLLKSLKNPVSEYLWTVNMLKGPKHCLSLHGSIFLIFFHHS